MMCDINTVYSLDGCNLAKMAPFKTGKVSRHMKWPRVHS